MDIETRTLRSLEWDKLLEHLAQEAESKRGKEICLHLLPNSERVLVDVLLSEADEAMALINARTGISFDRLPDLTEILGRLQANAVLSESELHAVRAAMNLSRQSKRSLLLLDEIAFPALREFPARLNAFDEILFALNDMLDDGGRIKDDATPQLRSLRSEVRRLDSNIKDELNRVIHSTTQSKALQEPLYTQRNGRYVLPVSASQRDVIPGIVHDSSQSGLTVFVEPMRVVELANKLRIKEAEIEHEIARILAELTAKVYVFRDEVADAYEALTELDSIFARAKFAIKYDGVRPTLSDDTRFEFKLARHPLLILQLGKENVVPNSVSLGGDERTLIITGPNTGGKTVLLKTIGLLSLMVRAGLLIPCAVGSKAALFDQVFADIGDEQSLAQSLSTFSSHMTGIVEVTNRAREGTLALLDEIGVGTDPREGAAIARSVLEHLNDSGAITVSTTHFGQLKTLAYNQSGMVNGSLEFDETSLSPTYKLRAGIPGSSKGITISRRLGLQDKLVEHALSYLDAGDANLDETVSRLESQISALEAKEEAADAKLKDVESLSAELQAELDRERAESEKIRKNLAADLKQEFSVAFDLIKETTRDLQKEPGIARAQQAKKQLEELRKDLKWLDEPKIKTAQSDSEEIALGDKVRVLSLNQIGVVEEMPDAGKAGSQAIIVVRVGSLKLKVASSDVKRMSASQVKKERAQPHGAGPTRFGRGRGETHRVEANRRIPPTELSVFVRSDSNTIDLRGERVESALLKLERFLDACLLNAVSPVMIIHGHGTGAVKEAVRDLLRDSNYIRKFRPGENYEGADGVTVADL